MNAKRCASPKNWNPGCGPLNYGNEDPSDLPAWEWHGVPLRNNTRIEIEKFAKPVLITCGDKDELWESDRTRRIKATLKRAGRAPEVHIFANEGHEFSMPAEQKRRELVADFFIRVLH
jgi:dienelactone hydrolase